MFNYGYSIHHIIRSYIFIVAVFINFIVDSIRYEYKLKHSTKQITEIKVTLIIDSNNNEYEFIDNNNKYLNEAIKGNNDYLYDTYENTYVKVNKIVSIQQFIFKKIDKYYKGEFVDSNNKYYTLEGIEYNK